MVDCASIRRADGRRVWRLQAPAVELLGTEFGLRFLVGPDRPVPWTFQATAFAPFSQNSKELVCFRSGQAQPGQSKPSGWFMDRSDRPPLRIALSSRNAFATACNALQPSYYSKLRHHT